MQVQWCKCKGARVEGALDDVNKLDLSSEVQLGLLHATYRCVMRLAHDRLVTS